MVNGAQISKEGGSLGGGCAGQRCKTVPLNNMNIEQLMKIIKTAVDGMNTFLLEALPLPVTKITILMMFYTF